MRKIVKILVLAASFMLCVIGTDMTVHSAQADVSGNDAEELFEYSERAGGSIAITKYKGNEANVVIPEQIEGKTVTYIGGEAFKNNQDLITVEIPKGVVYLDGFGECTNLKSVKMSEGVISISTFAFMDCKSLETVVIPKSVCKIEKWAFRGSSAKLDVSIGTDNYELVESLADINNRYDVTILDGVTSIEASAFQNCICLYSVSIPDSVTSIGRSAFNNCNNLSQVILPQNIVSIGEYAFSDCDNLQKATILSEIDKIEEGMFSQCKNLSDITLPDTVTSIEANAFSNCSNLSDIVLPDAVTSIGEMAFYSTALDSIQFPKALISIGPKAYAECKKLTQLSIPDGVSSIEQGAFLDCRSLEKATIPISVTKIGEKAFNSCHENLLIDICVNESNWGQVHRLSGRQNVFVSDEVIAIGNRAFLNCSGIISVVIPESVTHINEQAFKGCSSLVTISLPKSVEILGQEAFEGCSSLVSIEGLDNVKEIDFQTFKDCGSLTNIKLSDNLEFIHVGAFEGCSSLTNIELPDRLNFIGSKAFKDCVSLTKISIPADVTHLYADTFCGCTNLSEVILHESILSIDSSVFKDCTSLTGITLPTKISKIGESLFEGCTALETVVLPDKITSIGNNAFLNCSELKEIKLTVPLSEIGAHAFNGCSKLNKVVIPITVKKIDTYAFANCSNLSEICILNSECEIYDAAMTISDTTAIYGLNNSTAQTYAQNYDRKFEIYLCEHEEAIDSAVEPTCTNAGKTEKKWCLVCSEVWQESVEIPALGHVRVSDDRVEPTCTEEGKTQGFHCSRCNRILIEQRGIPAAGHKIVIDPAVAPTYTEAGKTEGSHCSVCNVVIMEQEEIPRLKYKYWIIFDSGCETLVPEQVISEGEKVQEPPALFKSGYVFTGWYTSLYKQNDSTKWDFANDIPRSNMSLYAGWDFVPEWSGHPINAEDVTVSFQNASNANMTYTGSFLKPAVSVKYVYNGKKTTLKENADYILEYKNNLEVGTATIKIYGTGEYSGSREINFAIDPKNISKVKVAALPEFRVSRELIDEVGNSMNVVDGTKLLVYGEDFDISISQQEVRTKTKVTVTITGKGNYTGTKSNGITFMLSPSNDKAADIARFCDISLVKNTEFTFTGNAIKPQVLVLRNGKKLSSQNYKVVYKDNIEAGTGYVVVYGCNEYCGTFAVPFTIKPKAINKCKLQVKNTTLYYNGREQKNLSFIVKDGKRVLKPGIDYTVTYVGDFKSLTGKVKPYIEIHAIEGGNYTEGTKTLTKAFKITKGRLNSTASIKAELTGEGVSYDSATKTYRVPVGVEPQVVITYNGEVLSGSKFVNKMDKTGLSYTYKLPKIKAGKKSNIKVTGANNFTGNISIKCIGY